MEKKEVANLIGHLIIISYSTSSIGENAVIRAATEFVLFDTSNHRIADVGVNNVLK